MSDAARGADIEITGNGTDAIAPTGLRINGQDVLVPADSEIEISDIARGDVVTVRLTVLVRSLTIRNE